MLVAKPGTFNFSYWTILFVYPFFEDSPIKDQKSCENYYYNSKIIPSELVGLSQEIRFAFIFLFWVTQVLLKGKNYKGFSLLSTREIVLMSITSFKFYSFVRRILSCKKILSLSFFLSLFLVRIKEFILDTLF